MNNIPQFLIEMLEKQYGKEITEEILQGFSAKRKVTFRVNALKKTSEQVEQVLNEAGIEYSKVSWSNEAYIVKNAKIIEN